MITLRLVNDLDQLINYTVDLDSLDASTIKDMAMDIYFHIWQHWGQKSWTTCVVWWNDQVVTALVNWDKDFWEENE